MPNLNLDQVRAGHALEHATPLDRRAVNRLPPMILGNGLLATVAFAQASEKRAGMLAALDAVGHHLKKRGLLNPDATAGTANSILYLTQTDSAQLRRATEEALAYLTYLKRFAQKQD